MGDKRKKDRLEQALQRQRWKCCWCGVQMKRTAHGKAAEPTTATAEHMIPQLYGGSFAKGNIRAACFKCNTERGQKMLESIKKSSIGSRTQHAVGGRT